MAQSYLIFAQDGKIEITEHPQRETILYVDGKQIPITSDTFTKTLLIYLTQIESGTLKKLELRTPDSTALLEKLKTCYDKFIVAAGGLVKNDKGELLLIFRNGKWDLPKGKLEKGEKNSEGAIREVQEETGLKKLKLLSEFQRTYHTYTLNEKRILKQTIWFLMQGRDEKTTPQQEEGITHIEWVASKDSEKVFANTYDNILLLIKGFFNRTGK